VLDKKEEDEQTNQQAEYSLNECNDGSDKEGPCSGDCEGFAECNFSADYYFSREPEYEADD